MPKTPSVRTLSDILLKNRVVNPEALNTAEAEVRTNGTTLEKYLLEKNLVSSDDMTLAISEYLDMAPINLAHFIPKPQLFNMIPREIQDKHLVVPVALTGKTLTVAMGDPFDIVAIDQLYTATGLDIIPMATTEKDIKTTLAKSRAAEAGALDMADVMKSSDDDLEVGGQEEGEGQSLEEMMESAGDRPVIRMVNMILIEAIRLGANDIHIEPQEDHVRLRYRVDGTLIEHPPLPKSLQSAIVSRIKILADLDIGEHRVPQDGRFRISALGKAIDVRVSVLPAIFGGRVVLRTLDKSALFPNLSALDLDQHAYDAFSYAIAQPHGIILVTGPTGSGKTTTLYSCLQELNKPDVNIITCEDPVEYQIPGLIHVKINPDAGCTFAAALRSILRQDPDIILIGEIRDTESAEIAIKAALTGHLVLSTLHANDATGTITRLLDMGLEPFLLASCLILTQGQRLFRKLCPVCKKEAPLPLDVLEQNKIDPVLFDGKKLYGPVGCPKCNNLGYKGRAAVMEVLSIDDHIRMAIIQQMTADDIQDIARKNGMLTLRDAGLVRVRDGVTSLDVILKLTSSID